MARKNKGKPLKATKKNPSRKAKFSTGESVYAPPKLEVTRPTSYLYGNEAIDAKKARKNKKRYRISNAGPPFKNNSNFAARNRKKRLFIARFPVIGPKAKTPAWFRKHKPEENSNKESPSQKRQLLNGAFSVHETAMKHLNNELEDFAAYVRLSPTEIRAREYLIQKIQTSCRNLFGVDSSQCQVFGSFAAQKVCIFESDIDLAIWGVVEADNTEKEKETSLPSSKQVDALAPSDARSDNKKQERINKWKTLIDNASKEIMDASNTTVEEPKDELNPKEDTKSPNNHNQFAVLGENEDTPLFVLDRTGDASDAEGNGRGTVSPDENDSSNGDESNKFLEKRRREVIDLTQNSVKSTNSDDDNDGQFDDAESDESHSDNADKLENFWSRKSSAETIETRPINAIEILESEADGDDGDSNGEIGEGEVLVDFNDLPKRRPRGQSLVSLSSSTTCSVQAKLDQSDMEVSYVVDINAQSARDKVGPSGNIRTRVVNSLYKLSRPLRSYASQMHVRKKARVPIINMVTHFGFECDIALGGHNGTDTSSYANTQLSRFRRYVPFMYLGLSFPSHVALYHLVCSPLRSFFPNTLFSFPTLVVFLKILLNQQGLDKPFTGGLGSYSLYVLVASHVSQNKLE